MFLQTQILQLNAREFALQQILQELAEDDFRFAEIFKRYEEYQAESISRTMIALEDKIGPARAAELDKARANFQNEK